MTGASRAVCSKVSVPAISADRAFLALSAFSAYRRASRSAMGEAFCASRAESTNLLPSSGVSLLHSCNVITATACNPDAPFRIRSPLGPDDSSWGVCHYPTESASILQQGASHSSPTTTTCLLTAWLTGRELLFSIHSTCWREGSVTLTAAAGVTLKYLIQSTC